MLDRRDFAVSAGALLAGLGVASRAEGAEIGHKGAAIHQEPVFRAAPAQVYAALTNASVFDKVVQASAAMNSGMRKVLGTAPTQIDARPGGAISLFGDYVTGFNLELVADTRLVQAWRAGSWAPGLFSIASFVLQESATGTRLVFDHKGFPDADAAHLAQGWHINYWDPLAKVLA